jgi:hypothetical protein
MHIADGCARRKTANGAKNLILQTLQFQLQTLPQIPKRDKRKSLQI